MRIGEAADYLGMSVVGGRKASREGRLPFRRSGSGQRLFEQADLDTYLGRPVAVGGGVKRVEALYCRVSGSTGQEWSLANQEQTLRDTASGTVFRVYRDRGSGLRESRRGLDRLLDDAEAGRVTVVRGVWRGRVGRVGGGWVARGVCVGGG